MSDEVVPYTRGGDVRAVAEALAQALADQLGQITVRQDPLDMARIRAYEITRRQLAGPSDDEADVIGIGSVVRVQVCGRANGPVRVGGVLEVTVRHAARVDEVVFAGADGADVATQEFDVVAGVRPTDLTVTVTVPEGAVTGPLTAVTDVGDLTFGKDVVIHDDGTGDGGTGDGGTGDNVTGDSGTDDHERAAQ